MTSQMRDEWSNLNDIERVVLQAMLLEGACPKGGNKKCVRVLVRALELSGNVTGESKAALTDASAEWTEVAEGLYNALIGLAQGQRGKEPFVIGKGNLGSPVGDPPAHPNFTECRLTELGEQLVREIRPPLIPKPRQ